MASAPFPDKARSLWRMKYRPDPTGPWKTVTLGRDDRLKGARPPKTPPQSVIDRHREFAEIEYNARHGIRPAPARAEGLAGYVAAYAEAYRGSHAPGSIKQLARHSRRLLAFAAGRGIDTVQGVTRAACRDYLEARIKAVSHNALRVERGFLMPIWSRALDDGLVAANPWARVRVPGKPAPPSVTFWTSEEIARIAAACRRPWQRDLVLVLANTGLRISTGLALAWPWVDWAAGTIAIPTGPDIKTSYVHVLGRVARDVLERRLATGKGDLVFPRPQGGAGRMSYDTARDAIDRAVARAGVRPGTPHDLRHSYARALALAGVPVTVIQSQLGHTTLAMTLRYVATGQDHAARFVADFGVGEAPVSPPDADAPSPRRP